jgi:hypothetical protein
MKYYLVGVGIRRFGGSRINLYNRNIMKISKTILYILILIILILLSYNFKKYVIEKDFLVYLQAPCTEDESKCFELDGEKYIKVYQKAYYIESCASGECDPYQCLETEDCEIIFCSEETIEEDESCVIQ